MNSQDKRPISDSPRKAWIYGLYAACALLIGLDLVVHRHVGFAVEGWYGFYGVFGFAACALLVLAARVMRKAVRREETYYDDK